MKKVKLILISTAITVAIGSALAFDFKAPCEFMTNYRYYMGTYVNAGTYGVNYVCSGTLGVCTYYKPWPGSDYIPCQAGTYFPIQ